MYPNRSGAYAHRSPLGQCVRDNDRVGFEILHGNALGEPMQEFQRRRSLLVRQEEAGLAHRGSTVIRGQSDQGRVRVDRLRGPEHPAFPREVEDGRPVSRRIRDQVGSVGGDLGGGIRRQAVLVSEVPIALVRSADGLLGELIELVVEAASIEFGEEAVLGGARDVGVIDDEQVVVLHE